MCSAIPPCTWGGDTTALCTIQHKSETQHDRSDLLLEVMSLYRVSWFNFQECGLMVIGLFKPLHWNIPGPACLISLRSTVVAMSLCHQSQNPFWSQPLCYNCTLCCCSPKVYFRCSWAPAWSSQLPLKSTAKARLKGVHKCPCPIAWGTSSAPLHWHHSQWTFGFSY